MFWQHTDSAVVSSFHSVKPSPPQRASPPVDAARRTRRTAEWLHPHSRPLHGALMKSDSHTPPAGARPTGSAAVHDQSSFVCSRSVHGTGLYAWLRTRPQQGPSDPPGGGGCHLHSRAQGPASAREASTLCLGCSSPACWRVA